MGPRGRGEAMCNRCIPNEMHMAIGIPAYSGWAGGQALQRRMIRFLVVAGGIAGLAWVQLRCAGAGLRRRKLRPVRAEVQRRPLASAKLTDVSLRPVA